MAVSGRKIGDFKGSISTGSAEDFDHRCEPCFLAIGQEREAYGYCVNCSEYLCKNCFAYHPVTKASKNHKLVEKRYMDKHTETKKESDECTEKCPLHKKEVIKFFCCKHESLVCNDCIVLNHRACDIDYIPDKCAGIGDSAEFRDLMRKLGQNVKAAENVIKYASYREKELQTCHDRLLEEIAMFRKEINDRLDQLQKQIQTDADKKKSADKQTVKKVLETCTGISSDIKQLQSKLQDYKTSQQNGQLYITMKQAKCKSYEIKEADKSLEKTNLQYTFEQNKELESMFSKQNALGKLTLSPCITSKGMKSIAKLTQKGFLEMKTGPAMHNCWITDCVVLPPNKLVVADHYDRKVKVIDIRDKAVIEMKYLRSGPWGIAVLPQDQIAVTMPDKKEILIMTTAAKLSTVRRFPVKGECRGIDYHQGHLYTVCMTPTCVLITDTRGNAKNIILLDTERFSSPYFLLLSTNLSKIFISDISNNSVVSITLQGDISVVYDREIESPAGMMLQDDGSLLVCCCREGGTIHRISDDFKQGYTMINDLYYQYSMCYYRDKNQVYVGCYTNQIYILSAK